VTDDSSAQTENIDYRELLESERSSLLQKLASEGAGKNAGGGGQAIPDASQASAWRGEGKSTTAHSQDALHEVESALRRLDDGTYGRCESCSHPIAPARLEALPAARRCVKCA
jgi:RNA polymerase-binding transcription factor DksA